jgi:hypothetical protein
MKEYFETWSPRPDTIVDLGNILEIANEYTAKKINLTLRQLYYKMLGRGYIRPIRGTKPEAAYKRLGRQLGRARYAGIVDWEVIEDRTRIPTIPREWRTPKARFESAVETYRLPRTRGQKYYVEIVTEKDTLITSIIGLAQKYHLPVSVFHGNGSTTAMYKLSKRILQSYSAGKIPIILYIGDHDPQGLEMLEDLKTRQTLLLGRNDFNIVHVALRMDQIKKFILEPNPTKLKKNGKKNDANAKYVERFNTYNSWEVDALPPERLMEALETAIRKYMDIPKMNAIIKRERKDKTVMRELIKNAKGEKVK